jgi:hypothetical protein
MELLQKITQFTNKEINLKQLTSELNKEREYLKSLELTERSHTEIAYRLFYNIEDENCTLCYNKMKFSGFNKGYTCKKKCETQKIINSLTQEEVIFIVKDNYKKYKNDYKKFSQLCRKYFKNCNNLRNTLYDIVFDVIDKPKCKICGSDCKFSSYKFYYATCCSSSCMTKYQLSIINPWTEERKKGMVVRVKETKLKRYGNENYNNHRKGLDTRISNGNATPKDLKDDFDIYYEVVGKYTRKNNHNLPNQDRRGRAGTDGAYHLDHRYSIMQGFLDNVPPFIIGSQQNLEYIPWEENQKKNKNCSIELEELCNLFYK